MSFLPTSFFGIGGTGGGGAPGVPGKDGWTPVLAVVPDGDRRVLLVTDWTGGTGTKPAIGVYVSDTGFVTNIALASDIRGNPGIDGKDGKDGADGKDGSGGTGGGGATVLFLDRQDNLPVLTHVTPTTSRTVVDRVWINANWGEWTEIASFPMADDVLQIEAEFVPFNKFSAKLRISSDVERPDTKLRIEAFDTDDGALLASAETTVNLLNINSILTPAVFLGTHKRLRVLPLSRVRVVLSAMVLSQGIQMGIVSNLPNEQSFISLLSTEIGADGAAEPLIVPGLFTLYVDNDSNLIAIVPKGAEPPLRYDSASGNLYYKVWRMK